MKGLGIGVMLVGCLLLLAGANGAYSVSNRNTLILSGVVVGLSGVALVAFAIHSGKGKS